MALVRCKHHNKPEGRKYTYVQSVEPVGWPDTAAICGLSGCGEPGLIWLSEEETKKYEKGQRVFGFNNASMKVRAE